MSPARRLCSRTTETLTLTADGTATGGGVVFRWDGTFNPGERSVIEISPAGSATPTIESNLPPEGFNDGCFRTDVPDHRSFKEIA